MLQLGWLLERSVVEDVLRWNFWLRDGRFMYPCDATKSPNSRERIQWTQTLLIVLIVFIVARGWGIKLSVKPGLFIGYQCLCFSVLGFALWKDICSAAMSRRSPKPWAHSSFTNSRLWTSSVTNRANVRTRCAHVSRDYVRLFVCLLGSIILRNRRLKAQSSHTPIAS